MELKVGPMTLKDLSVWFGLKPDTITKSRKSAKEKKFEILKWYADYHFEGRKLIIDKVLIPEYTKAFDIIDKNFDKEWGNIRDRWTGEKSWQAAARVDTCARVGKAMRFKYDEVKTIKEETAASYVSKAKTARYGKTYIKDDKGTRGSCRIVYLNEDCSGLLSDEQMKIVSECRSAAYAQIGEQIAKIDEAKALGELSAKAAQEAKGEIDTTQAFYDYQELLLERLGFIPVRRTQLVEEQNWNT